MQYMGGKTRIAKQIAAEIDKVRKPGQLVWDAFCGGLSVSVALSKNGPVLASDACIPLINLYKAVQDGWDPPSVVTKEEYENAKLLPDTDPMKAFCGFGCSFGGVWFGSFSRKDPRPGRRGQAACSRDNIIERVKGLTFESINFLTECPYKCESILYLDPPYAGTSGYGAVTKFDYGLFIQRVAEWSKFTHVFVSEYEFPLGQVKFQFKKPITATPNGNGLRFGSEKLFHVEHCP